MTPKMEEAVEEESPERRALRELVEAILSQQLGNRIKGDLRVTKVRDRVVITAKFEEWSQQTTINAGSPEEAEKMAEAVRNVIKVARGFDPTAAESG